MNSIIKSVSLLKVKCTHQTTQIATRTRLISNSDGIFRMGRIKAKYLRKSPIITTQSDGSTRVEGVSNKVYPEVAKWKTPEYLFRGNPGPDGSGDLGIFPEPDLKQPRLEFANLEAYKKAPEEVKRVLSLEMSRRKDIREVVHEEMRLKVAEHKYDFNSNVVSIASLTLRILDMQKRLALLAKDGHRAPGHKKNLKGLVDKRRAQLGFLRTVDYPKYEWLLEKLNIVYKPRPFEFKRVIRRKNIEQLVNLLCDETRAFKLQSYKDSLEEDQPEFLKKKLESFKQIMADEEKMELPKTVTKQDIEKIEERIKEVEVKLQQRKKRVIRYHVFEEPKVEEDHKVWQ